MQTLKLGCSSNLLFFCLLFCQAEATAEMFKTVLNYKMDYTCSFPSCPPPPPVRLFLILNVVIELCHSTAHLIPHSVL